MASWLVHKIDNATREKHKFFFLNTSPLVELYLQKFTMEASVSL